jgi:hypothetical protein
MIAACSAIGVQVASGSEDVQLVKAGFITKFPAFIDWPAAETDAASGPFKFCILGRSDLQRHLEEILKYTDMGARTPVLARVDSPREIVSCQVLYIPPRTGMPLRRILEVTEDRPILTVGDTQGYGERGVMINLYVERGQVRFEINLEAVRKSGLVFDFRLLELARLIGK